MPDFVKSAIDLVAVTGARQSVCRRRRCRIEEKPRLPTVHGPTPGKTLLGIDGQDGGTIMAAGGRAEADAFAGECLALALSVR